MSFTHVNLIHIFEELFLIYFGANLNGVKFLIASSISLLEKNWLLCINLINIYTWLINARSFLVIDAYNSIFPFQISVSFASFSYLIALARTFSTVLNMHGEKGCPRLVPHLSVRVSVFWLWSMMFYLYFFSDVVYEAEEMPVCI